MLVGERISLGAFVPDDYAAMFCWANDVVAARLNGAFRPANLRDVVSQCELAGKDPGQVMLAIRPRGQSKILGFIHIHNISAVHRSAEIGIRIGEEGNRGKGYGTEAMDMALSYCWNHLNLERVSLVVFRKNERAIKVYRKVGFRREGIMRRLFFVDGQRIDVVIMAAFRSSRTSRQRETTMPDVALSPVIASVGQEEFARSRAA
jgi:[ribosomal protein S5]-alanine N-acetyltransferase